MIKTKKGCQQQVDTSQIGILGDMDATEIGSNIRNGNISIQEAIDCVRDRAKIAEPKINAIVASNYDIDVSKLKLNKDAIFYGVPSYIKDLVEVKGFPCRQGSKAIPDDIIKKNDILVAQFESTGSVILGKSATSEFGFLPSCETLVNGATRNPRNLAYSTGGSSGGAGALVAAGVAPIAHTMDGGGSTRIPASCCGLIGLKPSRGRHVSSPTKKMPIDIVTHGIVSKTVRDSTNYFRSIVNYNVSSKLTKIGTIDVMPKKRLKIGLIHTNPAGIDCHPDVTATTLQTGKICSDLGHHVEIIENPYNENFTMDFIVYYSMMAKLNNQFGKLTYNRSFDAKATENFTKELGYHFSKVMMMAPFSIHRMKNQLIKENRKAFETYDVILSPVLSAPVCKIGYFGTTVSTFSMLMRLNNTTNFTMVQNVTGTPAISLPLGKCKDGLPIGMQFCAPMNEESLLLSLAFELEAAQSFQF